MVLAVHAEDRRLIAVEVVGDTRARIADVLFQLCARLLASWLARAQLSPLAQDMMARSDGTRRSAT